ncbi:MULTISPECIES: hypothetical protein [Francisella]|uniref:hypothetical protein n=1 Tax=Francisella TaxID=262 RepID=UPI0011B44DF3|nr:MULTISPECIES: hypothetical protein [Francisella]
MKQIGRKLILKRMMLLVFAISTVFSIFPASNVTPISNHITISNPCSSASSASTSTTISCNSISLAAFLARFKQISNIYRPIGILFIKMISGLSFLLIERIYRPPKFVFC